MEGTGSMSLGLKIALIGNPNCGKSTIFNLLAKGDQRVGNWPGVTTGKKQGLIYYDIQSNSAVKRLDNAVLRHGKSASAKAQKIIETIEIYDLPGIYSLTVSGEESADTLTSLNALSNDEYDLIINVIDASNLRTGLYIAKIYSGKQLKTIKLVKN